MSITDALLDLAIDVEELAKRAVKRGEAHREFAMLEEPPYAKQAKVAQAMVDAARDTLDEVENIHLKTLAAAKNQDADGLPGESTKPGANKHDESDTQPIAVEDARIKADTDTEVGAGASGRTHMSTVVAEWKTGKSIQEHNIERGYDAQAAPPPSIHPTVPTDLGIACGSPPTLGMSEVGEVGASQVPVDALEESQLPMGDVAESQFPMDDLEESQFPASMPGASEENPLCESRCEQKLTKGNRAPTSGKENRLKVSRAGKAYGSPRKRLRSKSPMKRTATTPVGPGDSLGSD